MLTLKGVFDKGKLVLESKPRDLPPKSKILVTFLPLVEGSRASVPDHQSDGYYQALRKHERKKTSGAITIIHGASRYRFRLKDYSMGGLSFVSNVPFTPGIRISAGITDPKDYDLVLMELDLEIRGVYEEEQGYKVGCQFLDRLDEDLWHGLMQYMG